MRSKQRALSQVLRPVDSIPFLHRVIARSDAGQSHSRVTPSSPRMPDSPQDGSGLRSLSLSSSPTSPSSEDFPPRAHAFVKTTFGKGSPVCFCRSSALTLLDSRHLPSLQAVREAKRRLLRRMQLNRSRPMRSRRSGYLRYPASVDVIRPIFPGQYGTRAQLAHSGRNAPVEPNCYSIVPTTSQFRSPTLRVST